MNKNAKKLNMMSTNYVNPHGLSDTRNKTTAKDLGVLA